MNARKPITRKLNAQFDAAVKSLAEGLHLLFIDDDKHFLDSILAAGAKFGKDALSLKTIWISPKSDATAIENKILSELDKGLPDAIVIDQRMHRTNAFEVVTWIREKLGAKRSQLRYLPIVVMSQYADSARDAAVMEAGADAFALKIDNLADKPSIFFDMLLFDLPWIQDRVEDRKWDDLQRQVGDLIAAEKSVSDVAQAVSQFISENMSTVAFYVRTPVQVSKSKYELEFVGGSNGLSAPDRLDVRNVPILKKTLDNDGAPLRVNSLSPEDAGHSKIADQIVGKHFLGIAIIEDNESQGTITAYRNAGDRPFRQRDEHYIRHLALQFAYLLQRKRVRKQITDRQKLFAEYFSSLTAQFEAEKIVEHLADFLAADFQNRGRKVRVTVALIEPGKRSLGKTIRGTTALPREDHSSRLLKAIDSGAVDPKLAMTKSKASQSIVLPMDSAGATVGAFLIEIDSKGRFSDDDINFLETVARVTANRIVSYRVRRFMIDMMKVVNALARPGGPARSTEDILAPVFEALWNFVGYRSLLYIVPSADAHSPWRIEKVHTEANRATSNDVLVKNWAKQFDKNWEDTFARKVLVLKDSRNYTDNPKDIADDRDVQGEQSLSMLLLPFRPEDGLARAAIGLTFVWQRSLNEFQRGILVQAGGFIAAMLSVSDSLTSAFEEKTIAGQFAILGKAMAMFRHQIQSEFGFLVNELALLELSHRGNRHVENLNAKLKQIIWNIEVGSRRLVKRPDPKPVDLRALVSQVAGHLKNHQSAAALKLAVDELVAPDLPELTADADIVANILELVGQNAVEAMVGQDQPGRIRIEVRLQEGNIAFVVSDNGPGIDLSLVPRLFGWGVTTKALGTGFGLAFARSRAREISGELIYDPPGARGARFVLTLPYHKPG
jgi:signal transduction histidine kinase/GAF domain-containing protein